MLGSIDTRLCVILHRIVIKFMCPRVSSGFKIRWYIIGERDAAGVMVSVGTIPSSPSLYRDI